MKFLCDNCKAKYQIADDKVAGKTVRMKCRKCGHQIEVRAAVTETSVSSAPPATNASMAPKPGAPRPSLATSLSAQKPRAAHSQPPGALAGAFQRTVEHAPQPAPFGHGHGHGHGQGDASVDVSVTDEWYVAINGVPVGPVRISELRRKAAAGAVTEDSLCWQEGLEEWRPVRSIPELAALVREAAQGNRVSLVAPPPPEQRVSAPPRPPPQRPMAPSAPRPEPPRAAYEPPRAPEPPPRPFAPPPRSNVVPLHARGPAMDDGSAPLTAPLSPPLGQHGPAGSAAAVAFSPMHTPGPSPFTAHAPPAPAPVADPFAVPPPPPAPAPSFPAASASFAPPAPYLQAPPRKGPPLWFWVAIVFALPFSVGGTYFVFFQKPPPPQQIVVQVPAPQTAQPTAATTTEAPQPNTEPAAATSASAGGKIAANGSRPGAGAAPAAKGNGAADLTGLLGGAGGPAVGPGGGPGGAGGGGLDQAAVQRVVRDRAPGVKRTCWERGGGDQKSSANVQVSVSVAANGSVSGATATGDDPVIAKCIENQVRNWSFPAPGAPTTVNIPFHFVRQ